MTGYTCDNCGKAVTYLIEDLCFDCFTAGGDYDFDRTLDERREREDERRMRQSEDMTRDFIFREVKE